MKNYLLTLFILILSQSIYGQDIEQLLLDVDSSSVYEAQFDFEPIAENVAIHEKVDFFLDNIVLRDTNSIFYFTGFDSYSELKAARAETKLLYSKIDTAEINSNLHFLDLNNDSKRDCVYDRLDLSFDFQRIEIFLDIESDRSESLTIPGFIITNFSFDQKMKFDTFSWSCCDETFRHYRQLTIDDKMNLTETHYHIPARLEKPDRISVSENFTISESRVLFERTNAPNPLIYLRKEIEFSSEDALLKISDTNEWELITGKFEIEKESENDNRIIGWIKKQ